MAHYNWTRYWQKSGDSSPRAEGFLTVWGEHEITYFPFEHFSPTQCLVLLGEPGMGKSNEIERIAITENIDENNKLYVNLNSIGDENRLVRKIFESEKLKNWKKGDGNFYLYLDSLDEALLNINVLSGLLADEISEIPTERLFLRVACRSAEWSSFSRLNNKLNELWKDENFQSIRLAPLTSQDALEAAKTNEYDGEKFLSEVFDKGVAPLAAKPVTLKLLLGIFKDKSEFPSNQSELYERGCLALCDEDYEDKPASKEKDELTPEQRLRIAARIAAIMIFSNKSSIWIGQDTGERTDADIPINELTDYFEINKDNSEFKITEKNILETIRKGLFKGDDINRVKFSHQTFAEFLAAWYLDYWKISDKTVVEIIGEKHLHPQLYETSAWIASRRKSAFKHLMKIAPMILLRSDVLSADNSLISELTEKLLEVFDSGESFDTDEYQYFRKLKHSELAEKLRPYIINTAKGWAVRRAAINIARSCKVIELQSDLLKVALDKEDDYRTRLIATFTLGDTGSDETLYKLKDLINEGTDTDKDLELKFYALEMLWGGNLTTQELFDALEEPPKGYSYFLSNSLGEKLKKEDLPIALHWLKKKLVKEGHLSYDMERLAEKIMLKAWDNLDQEEILLEFVKVCIVYFKSYQDIFRKDITVEERIRINQDVEKRRKVLLEMLPFVKKESDFWEIFYSDILSFRGNDAWWMIDEWNKSTNLSTQLSRPQTLSH